MKYSTALSLFLTLILISGYKADVPDKTGTTNTNPSNGNVEILPVVPSTNLPEPTTKAPTTKAPDTTTTPAPTTSTPNTPPTSPPTPPTSTEVPTTSSAPFTTTPVPDPTSRKWFVNETDGQILVEMAVQFSVAYNDTKNQTYSIVMDVPTNNDTKAFGSFNKDLESLTLSWQSSSKGNNSFTMNFKLDNLTRTYVLNNLAVVVALEELPHSTFNSSLKLVHKYEHFNTSLDNSYRCIKLQNFNLTRENEDKIVGVVKVSNLQFQAFKHDQKANFDLASDCAFVTPDAVPIAVGCVLAGLVVIILVGYLITRRRSQSRGYHSM